MQINRRQCEVAAAVVTGGLALMFGTLAILHRCGVARAPSIAVSSALAAVSGLSAISLACHARSLGHRVVERPMRPEAKAPAEADHPFINSSVVDLVTEADGHIQHFRLDKGSERGFWKDLAETLFGRAMHGREQMERQMRAVGVFRELHERYEAKSLRSYGAEPLPPVSPALDRQEKSAKSDSSTEDAEVEAVALPVETQPIVEGTLAEHILKAEENMVYHPEGSVPTVLIGLLELIPAEKDRLAAAWVRMSSIRADVRTCNFDTMKRIMFGLKAAPDYPGLQYYQLFRLQTELRTRLSQEVQRHLKSQDGTTAGFAARPAALYD
jgi:hypothetical protein